jgi:hypothetical protein
MASIPNVDMDESSCRAQLSTTGVFTYIAIVAHLNDETTFIHHISSTDFNFEAIDIRQEVQQSSAPQSIQSREIIFARCIHDWWRK